MFLVGLYPPECMYGTTCSHRPNPSLADGTRSVEQRWPFSSFQRTSDRMREWCLRAVQYHNVKSVKLFQVPTATSRSAAAAAAAVFPVGQVRVYSITTPLCPSNTTPSKNTREGGPPGRDWYETSPCPS